MPTLATPFIGARHDDERRSARHHEETRVRALGRGRARATLSQVDSTGNEVGDDGA